jgi:hypothetical protein
MKAEIEETCAILFKGQSNVAKAAQELGLSTEKLKETFATYAAKAPLDDSAWQNDVEIAWPFIT